MGDWSDMYSDQLYDPEFDREPKPLLPPQPPEDPDEIPF